MIKRPSPPSIVTTVLVDHPGALRERRPHKLHLLFVISTLWRSPGSLRQSAQPVPGRRSDVHPSTPPCRSDTVAGFAAYGFPPQLLRRAPKTTLFAPLPLRHHVFAAVSTVAFHREKSHWHADTK